MTPQANTSAGVIVGLDVIGAAVWCTLYSTYNPLVTREINGPALLAGNGNTSYDEEPIRGGGLKLLAGRWTLDAGRWTLDK